MYQLTGENRFQQKFETFKSTILSKPKTPGGMVFISKWGSARHAANAAFLFAVDAVWTQKNRRRTRQTSTDFAWAKKQVKYLLGNGPNIDGRKGSLLIGYGKVYPIKPHHRASGCRAPPSGCDSSALDAAGPNPWILYGALIGGPDTPTDNFKNDRKNYITNEVALDYNSGFQGLLAAMLSTK